MTMRTMLDYLTHAADDAGVQPPYELVDEGYCPALEEGVPNKALPTMSPRDEVKIAANTARALQELGDDIDVTEQDESRARDLFETARTPNTYEKTLPGTMLKLDALLTAYDHRIIRDADQIRQYVTNRLIEETEDPDPKIRIRAYELLGKISDVGLFTERKEVTINNKSSEELSALLKSKLKLLVGNTSTEPAVEADFKDVPGSPVDNAHDVDIEDIFS